MTNDELQKERDKKNSKWKSLPEDEKTKIKMRIKERRKEKKAQKEEAELKDQITHMANLCKIQMMQFRKYCCSICHRMFRKQGVRQLKKKLKQTLCEGKDESKLIIEQCLGFPPKNVSEMGEHICHTCLRNLKNGKFREISRNFFLPS